MRELVRTNDAVLITAIEALLNGAHIEHMVVDQNMSVMEGLIGSSVAAIFTFKNLTGGSVAAFCTTASLSSTTPSRFFQP